MTVSTLKSGGLLSRAAETVKRRDNASTQNVSLCLLLTGITRKPFSYWVYTFCKEL